MSIYYRPHVTLYTYFINCFLNWLWAERGKILISIILYYILTYTSVLLCVCVFELPPGGYLLSALKTSFSISCKVGLIARNSFFVHLGKYFAFILKRQDSWLTVSLSTLNVIPLLSGLPISKRKSAVNLMGEGCSIVSDKLFFCLQKFLLVFGFQHFYHDVYVCRSLCIFLTWSSQSFLDM